MEGTIEDQSYVLKRNIYAGLRVGLDMMDFTYFRKVMVVRLK